ncbi:MAG TPA: hypothetical protein VK687_12125 [Bryobacteraceae bacterium]|nr:hypothetical protein [Bryobacteraceae bacterium]
MGLRSRPMRPKDVAECARIVAAHPVIGPRYGSAIADLRPAWLRLLSCEAKCAMVLEEVNRSHATICFVGVSIFVGDNFIREIKNPLRWLGPELARGMMRGDLPLLSGRQLREANSRGGLNLIVWEGCIRPEFEQHAEVHRRLLKLFIEEHCGYLWKEVIASQMESVERLQWTLQTGGLLWSPARGRYVESLDKDPREILEEPHLIGVTREIEHARPGTWVGSLFDYHPPQLGFSPSEQQLLLSALSDRTDEELSDELGNSLSTVKNTWRSVYDRAASCLPDLFPHHARADLRLSQRGKEKRRFLMAYLREHPEELRPVSRKLPQQGAARTAFLDQAEKWGQLPVSPKR